MHWRWTLGLGFGIAGPIVALAWLAPESHYGLMQEDGALEWTTFWLLAASASTFAWRALRAFGPARIAPAGLALASAFVAGEEISWGQRVLGYRPTALFLTANFQQEANLHNLAGADARQLATGAALFAMGAVLPLALRVPRVRALADHVGLSSPAGSAPLFLGALSFQAAYPIAFAGEIVELWVGVALAAYAAASARAGALALLVSAGLGFASAHASSGRSADPSAVAAAQRETHALAVDLLLGARAEGRAATRCGVHQRLYELAQERAAAPGRWASFAASVADRERAAYFLDPWSSSYWVRDACAGSARSVFVYSFGPNRRRDSSERTLAGDDVGAYLVRREASSGSANASP